MLALKIAQVMGKIETVPKSGRNNFHKYNYASVDDIFNVTRNAMNEVGLALIPVNAEMLPPEPRLNDKGTTRILTRVQFTFLLVDTETGENQSIVWVGESSDTDDKGIPKCLVQALKYLLRALFLIPTGEEHVDGDKDAPTDTETPQGRQQQRQRPPATKPPQAAAKPPVSAPQEPPLDLEEASPRKVDIQYRDLAFRFSDNVESVEDMGKQLSALYVEVGSLLIQSMGGEYPYQKITEGDAKTKAEGEAKAKAVAIQFTSALKGKVTNPEKLRKQLYKNLFNVESGKDLDNASYQTLRLWVSSSKFIAHCQKLAALLADDPLEVQ